MRDRPLPVVTLLTATRQPVKSRTDKQASNELFLEWLENKEYIRSEILLHDKKYMEDTVDVFRRRTTEHGAPRVELDEEEDYEDGADVRGDECVTDQSVGVATDDEDDNSAPETSSQISAVSLKNAEPSTKHRGSSKQSVHESTKEHTVHESPKEQTVHESTKEQTVHESSKERSNHKSTTEQTVHESTKEPAGEESDDLDREMLLKQLDILRMRFKQAKIPENTESLLNPDIRRIVNRNVAQLKRNRNVATYKLGMVAVLLVMELFFARVCKVDVSRFMQWHYSNMQSYEEILVELGEVSSPITEASPMTQLCLLMFFNSALFVGNELMLKYFQVDVLNVMCSITGAQPPQTKNEESSNQKPTKDPPPPFATNFSRFL